MTGPFKMELGTLVVVSMPIFGLIVYLWFKNSSRELRLPPSPPGMFLLGNTFDVDISKVHLSLTKIGEKMGGIYSLITPGKTTVVVNSIEAYRELFCDPYLADHVSDRHESFVKVYATEGKDITTSMYTPAFRFRKQLLCDESRNIHGRPYQNLWQEETQAFLDKLESHGNSPQDLEKPMSSYFVNLCMIVLLGRRLDYGDHRLDLLVEANYLKTNLLLPKVNTVMSMFPWLRHLPFGFGSYYKRWQQVSNNLRNILYGDEKASRKPGCPRGALDKLLDAQQEKTDPDKDELTDDHIWQSLMSVTGAGSSPSTGSMLYFFLLIVEKPEIARRIQKEVDTVVGGQRLPDMDDVLPYTEATVYELLRWVSPAPALLPRTVNTDVWTEHYKIPKGTVILNNSWGIHHDEKFWKDPFEFRPERFLDTKGNLLLPNSEERQRFTAFGPGNRTCIGTKLGKAGLYVLIASVLQKFNFEAPTEKLPPADSRINRLEVPNVWPDRYKIIAKPRTK